MACSASVLIARLASSACGSRLASCPSRHAQGWSTAAQIHFSSQPLRASPPLLSAFSASAFSRVVPRQHASLLSARCALTSADVGELPPRLQKIVDSFQMVPDPRARYQQLLFYASKLPPLPAHLRTADNKVWVVPSVLPDGSMAFQADSDSALTKGLAALLCEGLTGATPQQVVALRPDFIAALGLQQSLTPSRNNGFLNMLRLMQRRALQLAAGAAAPAGASDTGPVEEEGAGGAAEAEGRAPAEASAGAAGAAGAVAAGASASAAASAAGGGGQEEPESQPAAEAAEGGAGASPMRTAMAAKIHGLTCKSSSRAAVRKAGEAGYWSKALLTSSVTQTIVKVVSDAFAGLSAVRRHRLVYSLLAEEFRGGLHALALVTRTPQEEAGGQ